MKTRIWCPTLVALLAVCSLSAAQPQPRKPAKSSSGPYDIVFLAQTRPLIVRLDVRVDGKPLQKIWDEFIDYVFKYADTDGDGMLNKEEAQAAPNPSALGSSAIFFGGFGGSPGLNAMDTNKDGKVTRQEFADYFRRSGMPPFQVKTKTENNGPQMGIPFQQATPSAADLNKALMKLLDTNRDGKLSRAELTAAPERFHKLDLDEDEVIAHKELLPDFTSFSIFGARAYARTRPEKQGPDNNPVFLASAVGSPRDLARRLLTRYAANGKRTLTRTDIQLSAQEFARLDRDGNGELDAEELARFLPHTPDLSAVVRLGERGANEPVLEQTQGQRKLAQGLKLRTALDTLVLSFGKERLAVRIGASKSRNELGSYLRQIATAQFQQADRDNNGYIDDKEAMRSGFSQIFKQLDRDGDGKVYEKELIAYLDKAEELQARATGSCVSLHFADGGRGLYDLFDADRDGRLSLREIQAMPGLVDELDRDGDGAIGQAEIPHSYLFRVEQGASGGGPNPFGALELLGMSNGPRPPLGKGPVWFQRMDRNRDGDVSRSEFLGSDALFRRIDSNGDGLISLEEVLRYEATRKPDGQRR